MPNAVNVSDNAKTGFVFDLQRPLANDHPLHGVMGLGKAGVFRHRAQPNPLKQFRIDEKDVPGDQDAAVEHDPVGHDIDFAERAIVSIGSTNDGILAAT